MATVNRNYSTHFCEGKEKVKMPCGEYIWLWPNQARKVRAAIQNGQDPYILFGIPKPNVQQNKLYCKYASQK